MGCGNDEYYNTRLPISIQITSVYVSAMQEAAGTGKHDLSCAEEVHSTVTSFRESARLNMGHRCPPQKPSLPPKNACAAHISAP